MARTRGLFPPLAVRTGVRLAIALGVSAVLVGTVISPVQAEPGAVPALVSFDGPEDLLPPLDSPSVVWPEAEFPTGDFTDDPADVVEEKEFPSGPQDIGDYELPDLTRVSRTVLVC